MYVQVMMYGNVYMQSLLQRTQGFLTPTCHNPMIYAYASTHVCVYTCNAYYNAYRALYLHIHQSYPRIPHTDCVT